MRFAASLRSSLAAKVAAFALGLTLFYYFDNAAVRLQDQSYAPAIVADAVGPISAFAYAVAGALAAWESGRLKHAKINESAPVRSRYLIGFNAILPVLMLCWLMLLLPVAIAFAEAAVMPTPDSMRPLAQQVILCFLHAIIGYVVGSYLPRLIAVPLLALSIYAFVAFSVSMESYWVRHVSGNYYEPLMFGELASFSALYPPLLFFGSVAGAAMLVRSGFGPSMVRAALAMTIAIAGMYGARCVVQDRGPSLPVVSHTEPDECFGHAPKICAPVAFDVDLQSVRDQAVSVIGQLNAVGVNVSPKLITDRTAYGRYQKPSDNETWRTDIVVGLSDDSLRFRLMSSALRFPCEAPDPIVRRAVLLWAAENTHERRAFDNQLGRDLHVLYSEQQKDERVVDDIEAIARTGLDLPKEDQGRWYRQTARQACEVGA